MVELPTISPTEAIVGASAVALGVGLGAVAIVRHRRKKKKKSRSHKRSRKKIYRSNRRRRGRRTPRTAGRGRDTSTRRIRYTRKGQPYVIMASGKARFIKKSGARRSHKQKGGRY